MSRSVPWAGWFPYVGQCRCGATVTPESFRDAQSWRRHAHTQLCQTCLDDVFFRVSATDPSIRFPLRRGVLAAPVQRECGLEIGILPLLFIVEARVAWQAEKLIRAGAAIETLNPWRELAPLHPALENHQVRLREFDGLGAPEVRDGFDVDMIVVLDESASLALDRLPFPVDAFRLVLDADLPWGLLYGAPLPDLLDSWAGGVAESSVLRICALLGVALEPMGAGDFFPLAYLIASHPERFPECGWTSPGASS